MPALPASAEERLLLLKRLRAEAAGMPISEFFRPDASALRFRLGTSLADLRIPWLLAPSFHALAASAAADAYLLAAGRQRPWLPSSDWDKIVVLDGYDASALRPPSYSPPTQVNRDAVRRVFGDGPEQHTALDGGLVASFLGTGRPGRAFAGALHALFSKAREEASRGTEPTPYLVALAMRAVVERQVTLLRDAPVGEPSARFLRATAQMLLAQALQLAQREAGLYRDAGLSTSVLGPGGATPAPGRSPISDPRELRNGLLALVGLSVATYAGARTSITQTGITAWGLAFDGPPPRLEETVQRIAQGLELDEIVRDLLVQLPKEKDALRRLDRAATCLVVRQHLRALSRAWEGVRLPPPAVPGEGTIEKLLSARDGVEKLFAQEARRKEFAQKAKEAARQAPTPDAASRLEILAHAAREYRDDDPASWMGLSDARMLGARSIAALAADVWLDRQAQHASNVMLERNGTETEAGGAAEYAAGRLYYITHEPMPLLATAAEAPRVGHLFCDMKDFTRRTAFLKETVIADFLQREFYGPILRAASGVDPGERRPAHERSVQLNNLLGDAVSFSGDVVALVRLAKEIRASLADYGRRLQQEASAEAVAERIAELEARHNQRRESLERSIRELTGRAQVADPSMRPLLVQRVRELKVELERQNALFAAEEARAAGEKLEAGSFLSFGAAPVVARFEDATFGGQRVAIAEKINESARGTARSGAVKARAEALRARAARESGRDLLLPFDVLIDTAPSFALTADESLRVKEALARMDRGAAEAALAAAAKRMLDAPPPTAGELYNAGTALSEEALAAYLDARGDDCVHLRRELSVEELHPTLRERFYFPQPRFEVVAVFKPNSSRLEELFVGQGRVLFKGFESAGGLGVYELCDDESPFFQLFAANQVPLLRR